jgi:hypothetical protein
MRFRHLFIQIIILLAVLASANVVIARLARNSVPHKVLSKGRQAEPATDLFLGNSTMEAGLDEHAFAAAKPGSRPLNLGMGSSSPVEHLLIFRQQEKHRGARVYYGFFDTHLTDLPEGSWGKLVGNRAMAYYVEPDVALEYYAGQSMLRRFGLRLAGYFPMLVERLATWAKVERGRRFLGEIGMPKKDSNRFGRAEDFNLLEANEDDFKRSCEAAVEESIPLAPPVAAIIRLAQERGSTIYIVEMPMPTSHRDHYYSGPGWTRYRAYVKKLVEDAGGFFVDASDWIDDAEFADPLHLSEVGAADLSKKLATRVPPP